MGNLNAALDALTEQNGQLQRDYAELAQRHRKQGAELSTASASLQVRASALPTLARPTLAPPSMAAPHPHPRPRPRPDPHPNPHPNPERCYGR